MKKIFMMAALAVVAAFTCFAANPASDFAYDLNAAGDGIVITGYKGKSHKVLIPDTIEGYPVTQIEKELYGRYLPCFNNNKNDVWDITIPNSVKIIGPMAFYNVKGKITANTKNFTSVGQCAFAFSGLSGTVTISKNCKFIIPIGSPQGDMGMIFEGSLITGVIIEDGVEKIGTNEDDSMFSLCKIKSITLPKSLKQINGYAFAFNKELTEINIPDGTKIIYNCQFGTDAFSGCSGLNLAAKQKIKNTGYTGAF